MTAAERGFLLLTCFLGNPDRRPLTAAQLRTLARRAEGHAAENPEKQLDAADLTELGYGPEMAGRIAGLLSEEELLEAYLFRAKQKNCVPLVRGSWAYPLRLRRLLGLDSPGSLWFRGNPDLLNCPAVALVGSRKLREENRQFAAEVGRQAARQGYILVSGNAAGADLQAQQSCLESGGKVISVVADELERHELIPEILYLSEDGFDLPFTAQRALSRNRVIHCLGQMTFAAQSSLEKGGTWDGAVRNLRYGWSPVFCFADGSQAVKRLHSAGAEEIGISELSDFSRLPGKNPSLFDQ